MHQAYGSSWQDPCNSGLSASVFGPVAQTSIASHLTHQVCLTYKNGVERTCKRGTGCDKSSSSGPRSRTRKQETQDVLKSCNGTLRYAGKRLDLQHSDQMLA